MEKWIPVTATFGLICLMVLPAPGIWGVLIGGICVLAIVVSAFVWCLDRMSSRVADWYGRVRERRLANRRRAVHASSGIVRKT